MNTCDLVIIDDHPIVADGIVRLFTSKQVDGLSSAISFTSGYDALAWFSYYKCKVIILDMSMPAINGIDLLKLLKKARPQIPILVFTVLTESDYALRAIENGASGYLEKHSHPSKLIEAVTLLASGKRYISKNVTELLVDKVNKFHTNLVHELLSDRELQVMLMIAESMTTNEIAKALCLNVKTIGTYRSRIFEKTHMKNNLDLMKYVIKNKLSVEHQL